MTHATYDQIYNALGVLLNECQLEAGRIGQEVKEVIDNPQPTMEWHIREPGIGPDLLSPPEVGPPRVNIATLAKKFRQQEFIGELTSLFWRLRSNLELHKSNLEGGHQKFAEAFLEDFRLNLRGEDLSRHERF